jgi:transposase
VVKGPKGIDTIESYVLHSDMAMGRRKDRARTPGLWIATNELPVTGGHPFYQRLNQVLDTHGFDAFVEAQCAPFYATTIGRPSLTPGTYFRLLLIGYFEGIDAERGIAWRTADSLALRGVLGLGLEEAPPDHSTIFLTRRLIDLETHREVFTWILQVLATEDLVRGKTIGIDRRRSKPMPRCAASSAATRARPIRSF